MKRINHSKLFDAMSKEEVDTVLRSRQSFFIYVLKDKVIQVLIGTEICGLDGVYILHVLEEIYF